MTFIGSYCIAGLSGPHSAITVQAHVDLSRLTRLSSFHSDCLDPLQSFPIKTTDFFSFVQPQRHPSTGTLRHQSCTRLLIQMAGLEQITLNIAVPPSFIRALEPVDGDLLCPGLRNPILIQANHEVDIWNSLIALSDQRMSHGCPLVCSIGSHDSDWWDIVRLERLSSFCSLQVIVGTHMYLHTYSPHTLVY